MHPRYLRLADFLEDSRQDVFHRFIDRITRAHLHVPVVDNANVPAALLIGDRDSFAVEDHGLIPSLKHVAAETDFANRLASIGAVSEKFWGKYWPNKIGIAVPSPCSSWLSEN
jgi:hypothetical protein